MTDEQRFSSVNEGIQAENVTGEAIGVGRGARAIVIKQHDREELLEALDRLRSELTAALEEPVTRAHAEEDLRGLEEEIRSGKPDPDRSTTLLRNVTEKLKATGVLLKEAHEVAAPILKLAARLGVPLAALGIV